MDPQTSRVFVPRAFTAGEPPMDAEEFLPSQSFRYLSLEVVDWTGPIVEIRFDKPIESATDAATAVREASSFMRTRVRPRASQAYFITCYDGLAITRETLNELREQFIDFNKRFSLGDVRYGGGHVAKTFVVSTAIQSASRSNHFETRAEALAVLHTQIRAAG
jgi:hypothetical protein